MRLSEIIETIKDDEVARAEFADYEWYITKVANQIRYCDAAGEKISDIVTLTFSDIQAEYEIEIA